MARLGNLHEGESSGANGGVSATFPNTTGSASTAWASTSYDLPGARALSATCDRRPREAHHACSLARECFGDPLRGVESPASSVDVAPEAGAVDDIAERCRDLLV